MSITEYFLPETKVAKDFSGLLDKGLFLEMGLNYMISGSKLGRLHNEITELQNELQLVKEGFKLTPSF